jgi:hypothetical protein
MKIDNERRIHDFAKRLTLFHEIEPQSHIAKFRMFDIERIGDM